MAPRTSLYIFEKLIL